jgi:hypothetical protein
LKNGEAIQVLKNKRFMAAQKIFRAGEMKIILILVLFLMPGKFLSAQALKTATNSFAVVELYTSEGCNTCPPADKLLSEIIADARKNKKPIYAMEFHVDIWNRLGWKDPYSSFQFTYRQKNYTDVLGEMDVYTPQVFVNGGKPFVGSDKKQLTEEIDKELKTPSTMLLKINKNNQSTADTLLIDYESSKTDKNMNLYIALVQRGLVSKINKGENSGKTLVHDNVVRVFVNAALVSQKGTLKLPVSKFKLNNSFSIYGFAQQKLNKKILAATGFDLL